MRLNLTVFPVTGAMMLGAILGVLGCVERDPTIAESPGKAVTVTEMVQQLDGSWTTTSRTVVGGQVFRPEVHDGVQATRSALTTSPCSHSALVALWENIGYTGNVVCLTPTGTGEWLRLPLTSGARSGYTFTPIFLYGGSVSDAGPPLVFFSCNSNFKYSSEFSAPAYNAQEASPRHAVCQFI